MNWTDEQKQTIETTGRSILVSAAAGSGKTTVLVERIKKLLIDEGTDIDRFLITTFTNAAAAEMKERLDKALRDEMKKPDADKVMLTRQLSKLPSASIGTFHSFAFDIVRQYFYLIDIEPGFSVADDVQIEIMKRTAVDNVFTRRYEENSEEFRSFILKYGGGRTDRSLRDNVLETCRTLGSIHRGAEWARAKAGLLASDSPVTAIGGYRFLAGFVIGGLEAAVKHFERAAEIANDGGLALCYETTCEDAQNVADLLVKARRAFACPEEELRSAIENLEADITGIKFGRMSYKNDNADEAVKNLISGQRDAGKKELDDIKNSVYGRSFDEMEAELKDLAGDTEYYVGLLEEYLEELRSLKTAENVIEFDDALHYAIDILEHEEAAGELRDRYEYIFVDEYQDSNYLQEEIVERIAREDNLFMVGDIKQCIYKFRLAEPELFRARAAVFADEADPGMLLHISSNFRSKKNVTDPVNEIFSEIMEGYDDAARLYCTAGDEHVGFPPRIHLVVNEGFDAEAPEKNDAEGAVIAGIIRERLGTEIYDTKAQRTRPLELRDFAVIVRNNREVEDIERYLINEGIAAYGESGGKYYETVEVQVFLNLLRIIENMRQDVPLISAMRSVVFGFDVRELAAIRIACREGSFSDAVFAYAEGGEDDALREKIRAMMRTIDVWKEISRTVPLEDLMKEILYGTGYYDYCSGLPVGTQRISNLRLIADKASKFEKMSHGGLYGFLRYIASMEDSDKTDSEAKVISEGEDVVRVMSVHKSKGLEFPVVIFANASKQTEKSDRSGQIKIHRDHGIGLPVVNREQHWHRSSLLQKMILSAARDEMVEEEIRILYVALTRAKDGLEIVGTVKNMDKLNEAVEPTTKTFLEMMYQPLSVMEDTEVLIYDDPDALAQSGHTRAHTPDELIAKARRLDNAELAALAGERLSFTYPYRSAADIRPKYSVTELNRAAAGGHGAGGGVGDAGGAGDQGAEEGAGGVAAVEGGAGDSAAAAGGARIMVQPFDPDQSRRTGSLTAAERGTLMHLLMEKADFAEAVSSGPGGGADARAYLQTVADRLLADDILTTEEYDSLSIDKAAVFFDSEIGRRAAEAAASGRLSKEKEFIFSMDVDELIGSGSGDDAGSGSGEGETTIVQGIIDCFFSEGDGLILIDYKNSYMGAGRSEDDIRATYAGQIDLYSRALEGATGKPVKEAYLFLFDTGQFIKM